MKSLTLENNVKMSDDEKFGIGDRDSVLTQIHLEDADRHAASHTGDTRVTLTPRQEKKFTEAHTVSMSKERLGLIMLPSWGVLFPPYNLARLAAATRAAGYDTTVYDVNVRAYHYFKEKDYPKFWDGIYYHAWENKSEYYELVHDKLLPLLDEVVDDIIYNEYTLVGFSIYLTNFFPVMHVIQEIKRRNPNQKIVVGGPEVFNDWFEQLMTDNEIPHDVIDYLVKGEGERHLIQIMDKLSRGVEPQRYIGTTQGKLDLNALPYPDYSDYDINEYTITDGVSIETSRGCVAKCSFCAETWFWKYRWRKSTNVIAEIREQMERWGTNRFWFVDSLANGNFYEFKTLVEELAAFEEKIKWNSYARCDGRMDLEFFHKMRESGCLSLSFGIESGSQQVLDDMQKKVSVEACENNLRDSKEAGVFCHVNWVVGFPTETYQEFAESLAFLYNCRDWIYAISPGYTCGDAPFSDMNKNWDKYKISWNEFPWDNKFMSNWWTHDYQNTIIHRFIRLKLTHILLDIAKDLDAPLKNVQSHANIKEQYSLRAKLNATPRAFENTQIRIEDENEYVNNFQKTIGHEYASIAGVLLDIVEPGHFTVTFNHEDDFDEWGGSVVSPYNAYCRITIHEEGYATVRVKHDFTHKTLTNDPDVEAFERNREDMGFGPLEVEYKVFNDGRETGQAGIQDEISE